MTRSDDLTIRPACASFAVAAAVALALAATETAAQTSASRPVVRDSMLEDIVVTAQRRTESIMDVPISISAIGADAIARQRISGIDDVIVQMPNVSFVSLGSRDRKEISIRGISNQLDPFREGRQLTYAMYIDEFNVAVGTSNPEILDLERIEVLRGPQGTYFGRNSVGGAINITTKKPDGEWFGEVGAGVGNHGSYEGHGIFNIPLIDDRLAARVSGQIRRTDGWIENINATGGGNDGEFNTARASLRFTPNERTTWDLTYSYTDGEEGMRVGVPTGFLTATWRSVYYQNRPGNVANPDGVGFYPDNRDRVNFNTPQSVGQEYQYASTRFQYDFDTMSLVAVGGWLDSELFNLGDVDGGSIDAFNEFRNIDRGSKSAEVRLQSRERQTLEWSVGAIYGQDTGELSALTYHGRQSPLNRPAGTEVTAALTDTDTDYWALFGQGTWNITDAWRLIVGGRYSQEDVSTFGITRSNGILTGTNDRTTSFSDFSPRVTVSYQTPTLGLVFATASKGFKAGGPQTSGTVQLRNEFDPEELWNYELGWKGELFDRRLRMDLTAFYMDWSDVQQFIRFQFIDSAGLLRAVTGIANAASARTMGAEMSADVAVSSDFRVGAQVGYLEAKYGNYPNALIDGVVVNASGKRLINAPKWTISSYAEYTRELMGEYEGFLRAEYNRRSEQLSSTFALRYEVWPFIAPAYDVVNLRAGFGNDRWDVNAFVENAFDEDYFTNAYEQAFYSGVQVEPSTRLYGLNVRFRFGGSGS
jgi:iron complex outermembrane receptor protein